AIENAAQSCPEILLGAGTVLSLEKCKEAISRGAAFIVSPGFDPEIAEYCLTNNVAVFPGCVTPTEIIAAIKFGLDVLKFFPANVYGGAAGIKALSGPFPGIKFIPTGGINNNNIVDFLLPQVFAIGGSWFCEQKYIQAGDFAAITASCKTALEIVRKNNNNRKQAIN
ncbi:MAG: bifunctional 4-hydroxy-2-oxoglutarate aldolase/2-dehydro-3-deoxy-phosphogluconate aldolase, partial [Treponema sp.]|nr:bifunctional 4-hydroxy-2-oxoglutarate aldolase/2-dehydro-3-deoxy-phosphogluconate aldolase [Treponema sp.]